MTRRTVLLLAAPVLLAGCHRGPRSGTVAADNAILIGRSDIVLAAQETLRVGPAIAGTLAAERSASVRAEIGGTVTHIGAEPGQRVTAGMVLARIEDAARRDAFESARSAAAAAEQSAALARRNAERAASLASAGAIADREREQAEWARTSAEAQMADARARLARAEHDLGRTAIRAPFAGVVSERPVSEGDVVQAGTPLFTVVDPRALKLEGTVPVAGLEDLRVGTAVTFLVEGAGGQPLTGRVSRINPVVDPATRQVRVTVAVPNTDGRLVAGLFADGRVTAVERAGVVIPVGAVDRLGLRPSVSRIRTGKVEHVEVELGLTDEARERVEIRNGLAAGDTILVGGVRGLPEGTLVRLGSPSELSGTARTGATGE